MKKIFFLLLLTASIFVNAQQKYAVEKDIHYYPDAVNKIDKYTDSQCTLDIYYPKDSKNFATIVWFHGGGLTGGSKEIPNALLEKGFAVIGVGYRLSPKVKAPVCIEDAAAAIAWAFQNIERYGGRTDLIFLSGHSAGGYLTMMVGLDKKYLAKYDIDANRIAGNIPFSGHTITHFTIRKEMGMNDIQPLIDKYAPLYFVRQDAPPLVLVTGDPEMELLGRYEENAYMWRMMKLAGHKRTTLYKLEGFDHGAMAEPAFPLLIKEVNAIKKEILERN
ncbi:alpha/beta hydrolase [Flavobacterium sp.]|uniref:alpha/beta hydrolase n=1 Tax=Flavobacterium sp. TaxID=239 RepID=UPI0025C13A95|nr:alpha/beta hydrolase [Flavobacterium sp.]MBA4277443.1 lipase [Flavobacterium sp.]